MPILTPEERLGQWVAGRYRLDAVLSSGGMGVLFRGTDTATGEAVAAKMLKPAYSVEPDKVARFLRETRIASALRHPNIALVLEVWQDETGVPFLIMELLRGRSLAQELERRGTLPLEEALAIVLPVVKALGAAHATGIIHRDVKPGNIFLCQDGASLPVPKLLDFGIAKTPCDDFETQTGLVLGTPGYMAPEQARHGDCGPFTDIWGVGAVLHHCLTGKPPHAGGSVADMLVKLVRERVPPLAVPGVSKSACATIDRALSLEPERRYGDMHAFARALASLAAGDAGGASNDAPAPAGTATEEFQGAAPERAAPAKPKAKLRFGAPAIGVVLSALAVSVALSGRRAEPSAAIGVESTISPGPSLSVATAPPPEAHPSTVKAAASAIARAEGNGVKPAPAPAVRRASRARALTVEPRAAEPVAEIAVGPGAQQPARRASEPVVRDSNTGIPVATEW